MDGIGTRNRPDNISGPRPPLPGDRGEAALVAKAKQNLKGRPIGRPFFMLLPAIGDVIASPLLRVIVRRDSDEAISRIYLKRGLPRLARLGSQ